MADEVKRRRVRVIGCDCVERGREGYVQRSEGELVLVLLLPTRTDPEPSPQAFGRRQLEDVANG